MLFVDKKSARRSVGAIRYVGLALKPG
jgi:hypothetical protein